MDEDSYDGTEQTPQPTRYRPPPMHGNNSQTPRFSATPRPFPADTPWRDQSSSFSYSLGTSGSSLLRGELEESLQPSLDPPSPLSRRVGSLIGDPRPSYRAVTSRKSLQQQPPISEVRVETEDDTFFECLDDDERSLLQRTRRSLQVPTPQRVDEPSLAPSVASSYNDEPLPISTTNNTNNTASASPSAVQVSRVQEGALQALMRLKEELSKSNDRNKQLQQEKEQLVQDLQQQQSQWEAERQQLHEALDASKASTEQYKDLDSQLRRERKESMHRKLVAENRIKELQHNLDRTTKQLEEASKRELQWEEQYTIVTREKEEVDLKNLQLEKQLQSLVQSQEDDTTVKRLQEELQIKDQKIAELTHMATTMEEKHQGESRRYQEEIQKWKQQYKEESEKHKHAIERLKSTSSSSLKATPRSGNVGVRFQDEEPLESSIADRLARMRDSAERAHLIKTQKREIARLKLDYEEKLQKLIHEHQEAMRKAKKHADTELTERLEDVKKALRDEYEEKLQETDQHHQEKFAELQREYMRNQERMDESLEAALSKIAHSTQQNERETSRRAALEMSIQQLHRDMEEERERLKSRHAEDLEKKRQDWELERDTLLTIIQKDCNMAFEQHRRQRQNPSRTPKHTSPSRDNSPIAVDAELYPFKKPPLTIDTTFEPSFGNGVNLVSPAYSEMDDVLRETEDLIQSIF